jgi:hypothetical protein
MAFQAVGGRLKKYFIDQLPEEKQKSSFTGSTNLVE